MRVSTVLHNFLREEHGHINHLGVPGEEYSEMESTSSDPDARELTSADVALQSLERCSGREAMEAMAVRSALMRYFSSTERWLPWQGEWIGRISLMRWTLYFFLHHVLF